MGYSNNNLLRRQLLQLIYGQVREKGYSDRGLDYDGAIAHPLLCDVMLSTQIIGVIL